jgi:hypothetical protein
MHVVSFFFFGRLMWDFPFVTTCDDRFFSSVRGPYDFEFFVHALLRAPAMVEF